ncbi:hypothetical protein AAFF_G00139860 [Aldrovandia affinis]|uniref:Proliferation-associated SNF2-like protein n=1 Tax=Aldrovandia affinis TaxID=143900 RepID=A0AAD7TC72_9TELE|nr:hypothetical protein AAFF_G00139860 [Aldrovandia affinis]
MDTRIEEGARSVSPQCPKPNESEEPQGTTVEDSVSLNEVADMDVKDEIEEVTITKKETDMLEEVYITKEMEEEERLLMEAGERREKEMMDKAREVMGSETQEMRYKRLQHLLDKSNIYSKFLLTKMEQQQLEEKMKRERLEKRALAAEQKGNNKKSEKVERKKREREEDYKISDVMSKEEILSKSKKPRVEGQQSDSSKGVLEDLEKITESNSTIKGRLSEAMRDNAQHMLDPERTVNGQPVPAQQPKLFTGGVMRSYQVEGIEWLRMLWENGINGILADEMGLGKTIQCIAHVAMMLDKKVEGPFLVVGPLSTLPNWMSEFKRFTPEITVMLYHGPHAERLKLIKDIRRPQGPMNMCPVVITSYEMAMRDRKYLQRFHWKYMIVDEGHRIKNMNCRLVRELKTLPTDNKLLLTGTPLQNNLSELWSLLNFLLPDVFDDLRSFESWFDISTIDTDVENIVVKERETNILHMLHQILTPFLLRRLKTDVTLEVPPKKEILVFAPLTPKQESLYTAVVNKTISKVLGQEKESAPVEHTSSGRPKRRSSRRVNYREDNSNTPLAVEKYLERLQEEATSQQSTPVVNVQMPMDVQINLKLQNILMLLRKCCNHPYLIEYPLDPATQEFKIDEMLVETSGKFQVMDRMLPELKKRGHKVLIFSQMTSILDLLMDYCYLRDYKYSRLDGSMSFTDREENMKRFASDENVFLFLLSTRAGGLGINLTAADTVIIFDSDWNPQADLQAQDRCHRIGQTKPVVVYRLITANTIDHKILEKASAKRKLEKMVIHKNKFKGGRALLSEQSKSCMDLEDLMELLNSRDYEREVKGTKGKVISDRDLEVLLDRSDLLDQAKRNRRQKKDGVFQVLEDNESSKICLS